jgi:NAD(P)-dependent dehydrogenase (short-subunit alcohol dehydrogenase family)
VLVTGAGSGIGAATARRYAAEGARLALAGRDGDALEEVADECRAAGAGDVLVVPVDVTDPEACELLVGAAVERLGALDACVHAAAVAAYGRLEDIPLDAVQRVLETNLLGSLYVARPVLARMREQGHGSLVLVGSVLGRIAVPEMGAYVVSKWGVRALGRVLALETRDAPGISVSVVAPGGVRTPIYPNAGNWSGKVPQPPWPVADPESTARTVVRTAADPRREQLTGWATPLMVAGSVLTPRLFDVLVGPAMRRLSFSGAPARAAPGNLWEPEHGEWDA